MYLLESIKQSIERGWRLDWIHGRHYWLYLSLRCSACSGKTRVTMSVDRQMSKTKLTWVSGGKMWLSLKQNVPTVTLKSYQLECNHGKQRTRRNHQVIWKHCKRFWSSKLKRHEYGFWSCLKICDLPLVLHKYLGLIFLFFFFFLIEVQYLFYPRVVPCNWTN